MVETHKPVSFASIPSDAEMARKYFEDIANSGDKVLIDCTREILKAIWLRVARPELAAPSDGDLGEAIGKYFRRMNVEKREIG